MDKTGDKVNIQVYIPDYIRNIVKEKVRYFKELDYVEENYSERISDNHLYWTEPDVIATRDRNSANKRDQDRELVKNRFKVIFERMNNLKNIYIERYPNDNIKCSIYEISYTNLYSKKENKDNLMIGMPYYILEKDTPDKSGFKYFVFKDKELSRLLVNATKEFDKNDWDFEHSTKLY